MKISYKDIIEEISEEIEEGVLLPTDTIQILRDDSPVYENYCPILDWYYDDYTMDEELSTPIEEMYLPEEFTDEEWAQMKSEQTDLKKQYEADKPKLIEIKVKDAITEMKQMQKLFK